jgi:hypothetical protein
MDRRDGDIGVSAFSLFFMQSGAFLICSIPAPRWPCADRSTEPSFFARKARLPELSNAQAR